MRKSFRGNKPKIDFGKEFRVNEKILAPEIIVIDENGENLGLMKKFQALSEAQARNFDLVEVSPKANPPICKFLDYGSFKYQKEKQERKQKAQQKTSEIKTLKISNRISQHDSDFRVGQAIKFLRDGDKVKVELQLRGRENQHPELAVENIKKIIAAVHAGLPDRPLKTEQEVKRLGNKFSAIVSL